MPNVHSGVINKNDNMDENDDVDDAYDVGNAADLEFVRTVGTG